MIYRYVPVTPKWKVHFLAATTVYVLLPPKVRIPL